MQSMIDRGEKYDVIVLDPPKFARDRKTVPDAMKGYRRLLQAALQITADDAVVAFCCCTGLITMEDLEDLIQQQAGSSGKTIQILERRGPGADHPVAATCREGHYLKCLILRVAAA
jgi:23S rRNA (cytosine1962-C5)-methyltransferase